MLGSPHRVGRSRSSHLRLEASEVSGEHALFRCTDRWTLRDLGSRNGTWVNGVVLRAGLHHPLNVGDVIGWGTPEGSWRIDSINLPSASALCGARIVEGEDDLLALPSIDDPEWVAHLGADDHWEGPDGPVFDGHEVRMGADVWRIRIPEDLASTRSLIQHTADQLAKLSLEIAVSRDEEDVEVSVRTPDREHTLKPKGHHYLLLTLARARRDDRAEGLPEPEAGWRSYAQLTQMVRLERNHVYVGIHRLRKEMLALGLDHGDQVVERRAVTNQLRIGVARFEIRRL